DAREALGRPAARGELRAGVHAHRLPGPEAEALREPRELAPVRVVEREFEIDARARNAEPLEQPQRPQHLVLARLPWEEPERGGAVAAAREEPGAVARAEQRGDGVREPPVAVQLQREVEAAVLRVGEECGERAGVAGAFGEPREAGELDEVVDVAREARG